MPAAAIIIRLTIRLPPTRLLLRHFATIAGVIDRIPYASAKPAAESDLRPAHGMDAILRPFHVTE
jgi:hypothetical protein